jgi:hypothetical protein
MQYGNQFCFGPISLERALHVLVGEDRKSRSKYYFSVLASSSLHRFDRALHMMSFPYSIFFNNKKGEIAGCFSFSWHIRFACVFT